MLVEISQETVDHSLGAGVVVQGLAHDLAGQGRGQRADLALELRGGLLTLGTATLVHLVTLPTELDASYRRALPMLDEAGILIEGDRPHAERILRAAALTYVAASLMSLLNVARWWAILRR